MRRWVIFAILMACPLTSWSQPPSDPADRAAVVKSAVGTIAGSEKRSAEIILNDLREFNGNITAVYPDHFVLVPAKKGFPKLEITVISVGSKQPRKVVNIRYSDVLQVSSKSVAVSFVPDPAASPYSDWGTLASVGRGEYLHLRTIHDKSVVGVFIRSTSDSISLMKGNREVVIPSADVEKIYRIKGDARNLASKILTGGSRSKDIEPWLSDATGRLSPTTAVIGAVVWMLPIGKTSRVLVYSR